MDEKKKNFYFIFFANILNNFKKKSYALPETRKIPKFQHETKILQQISSIFVVFVTFKNIYLSIILLRHPILV